MYRPKRMHPAGLAFRTDSPGIKPSDFRGPFATCWDSVGLCTPVTFTRYRCRSVGVNASGALEAFDVAVNYPTCHFTHAASIDAVFGTPGRWFMRRWVASVAFLPQVRTWCRTCEGRAAWPTSIESRSSASTTFMSRWLLPVSELAD